MLYPTIIKLKPRPSQSYGYTVSGLDKRKVMQIKPWDVGINKFTAIIQEYALLHDKEVDESAMAYDEQTEQWIALVTFK